MSIIRKFAARIGLGERRRDGRVRAGDLDVSYWTGVEKKRVKVRDVSPTGIYVLTDDHWLPGTSVLLTMQNAHRRSLFEEDSRPEVRLPARAVRVGEDGVGLTFVQDHIKTSTWLKLMYKATSMVSQNDAVRVFRVTKALAFLLRISPEAEAQVLKLITEEMGSDRAQLAVEIVLKAEEMLQSQNRELRSDVAPALILRILTNGSDIEDERLQQSWAGLLAVSCSEGSTTESILSFVGLLSGLDPAPIRILTAACTKAMETGWNSGFVFPQPLTCSLEDIKKIAGARTMIGIEQDLNRLNQMGLLQQTVKANALSPIEEPNLTPTALGLQLYARCTGQTELPDALQVIAHETTVETSLDDGSYQAGKETQHPSGPHGDSDSGPSKSESRPGPGTTGSSLREELPEPLLERESAETAQVSDEL